MYCHKIPLSGNHSCLFLGGLVMINIDRKTKIVCTLGPATDKADTLEQLICAGADVLRLNFSHGSMEDHIRRAAQARELSTKCGRHVAIMGDLQGPKIRVSTFENDKVELEEGAHFTLDASLLPGAGTNEHVGIDYKALPSDVACGDILMLDDGRIQLRVEDVRGSAIHTTVLNKGVLSNNKGINKLGGGLSADTLTEKDKRDIDTAAKIAVDYLAISFPRTGDDLRYARSLAQKAGCYAKIVAKVERAEAVESLAAMDDIILAADVVMVARGDLGVEIGDPELAAVQKQLISRARKLDRVVITATQMMESMINNPLPTRAEVLDVSNAVLDGTDAVMLSAETATGSFPVETVQAMARICLGAERMALRDHRHLVAAERFTHVDEAIAHMALKAAEELEGISAIVSLTESGRAVVFMSRAHTGVPIFALSHRQSTLNQLSLLRGVTPVYFSDGKDGGDSATIRSVDLLKNLNLITQGSSIVITQGDQYGVIGSTNTCKILKI